MNNVKDVADFPDQMDSETREKQVQRDAARRLMEAIANYEKVFKVKIKLTTFDNDLV
jgi:hypothetical protein